MKGNFRFSKKPKSEAQIAWKALRSRERWDIRAEYLMDFFSPVSVMLPSQISHLKQQQIARLPEAGL